MRLRTSIILLPLLLAAACDADSPSNTDQGTGEGTDESGDEPCAGAAAPVPVTWSISLIGFPEVEDNALTSDVSLDFEGPCTVDAMDFAADQLTLSLSCEHPAPSVPEGTSVTITTAATGLPANVEVGDLLTFRADVPYDDFINGDASGPIFRGIEHSRNEVYELSDADGLVFGATVDRLGASFEPIMVRSQDNCPNWDPCYEGGGGDIAVQVIATIGDLETDLHVGEVVLLESGDLAWDASLFEASLSDSCPGGKSGGFSVVRRPEA